MHCCGEREQTDSVIATCGDTELCRATLAATRLVGDEAHPRRYQRADDLTKALMGVLHHRHAQRYMGYICPPGISSVHASSTLEVGEGLEAGEGVGALGARGTAVFR